MRDTEVKQIDSLFSTLCPLRGDYVPASYLVSTDHIDYLISAGIEVFIVGKFGSPNWEEPDFIGRELLRQNYASVLHENGGQVKQSSQLAFAPGPDTYHFRPFREVDAVQVFKALDCYVYQASNHPGWENSHAERYCRMLRILFARKLPGYDNAMWDNKRDEAHPESMRLVGVEEVRADLVAARGLLDDGPSSNSDDLDMACDLIDRALKALCPHDVKDQVKSHADTGQPMATCTRCNVSWAASNPG